MLIGREWKVIDLCCGLGGISLAASQLGCRVECGVDISASSLKTFQHNFPHAKTIQDNVASEEVITKCKKIVKSKIGRTLVVSGPPCQGFSVAGPRVRRDPRNQVLYDVAKAITRIEPDAAIIENVAALLTPKHKHSLSRFKRILRAGGYNIVILEGNAVNFGTPQIRRRMLCFAAKSKLYGRDIKKNLSSQMKPLTTVADALSDLGKPIVYQGQEASIANDLIVNHVAMRHSDRVIEKISAIAPGSGPLSYRRLDPTKPARTLLSGHRAPPAHYEQPRSITVREAARLQGFPDTFEIKGCFSNQMLHVTNAVPPPLAYAAINALLMILEVPNVQQ